MMDVDSIVQDCLNKGFIVIFRPTGDMQEPWECCVERPNQFPGAQPFSKGRSVMDAVIAAARYARAPGY